MCSVSSLPFISRLVPGVQTLPVCLPAGEPVARNWNSMLAGNDWSSLMLSGDCEWIITPLLSLAQGGESATALP